MEKQICKPHTKCRACGSEKLTRYLSLGNIPLANNLENSRQEAIDAQRFPLEVMLCEECGLSQLSTVIDPEKLFSYYTYRSSVNGGYVKHCREMAKTLKEKYNLNKDSFVIDIAGNDGTLLKEFKAEIGCRVLNIDPAVNLCVISRQNDIDSIPIFWSTDAAIRTLENYGGADIITATNVFAHVNNIEDFLNAAKVALKPNGVLIIECPYMIDHLEKYEYTQVYFEHLSYMSVSPICLLCKRLGMKLIDVEKQEIHGGTIRMTISHESSKYEMGDNVGRFLDMEYDNRYLFLKTYKKWADEVKEKINDLDDELYLLTRLQGWKVAAFSASAKGNTLLNSVGINDSYIDYIVDDTPEKQGKYSPGTGIHIVPIQELTNNPPDYLLLLSWNFQSEIMEKCRKLGYKGKFIIPIPEFKIID